MIKKDKDKKYIKKIVQLFNKIIKKETSYENLNAYRCPECKHIILIEDKFIQNYVFACPYCEQKNILNISDEKPEKKPVVHYENLNAYRCPKCKHIILIEDKFIQNYVFACPYCEQKNIFKISIEKPEIKPEKSNKIKNLVAQINFNAFIIGFILIMVSIALFFFNKNILTIKLSLTLLILGIIFPLFITEKKRNISMVIIFGTLVYIILLFFATGTEIEIFVILIFIGLLIIKIMIDQYLFKSLKFRINLFLISFFIIFLIIILKRIISLIGI